ncbi:MAG TPA: hypothetical protein V6D27_11150 [Vampirovibrionales bacterium]
MSVLAIGCSTTVQFVLESPVSFRRYTRIPPKDFRRSPPQPPHPSDLDPEAVLSRPRRNCYNS